MLDVLVDVGGTGLKLTYACDGKIVEESQLFPANSRESAEYIIRHFCEVVAEIWKSSMQRCGQQDLNHVYMAFPGPFDYEKGISLMQGLNKYDSIYGISIPEAMNACFKKMGLACKPSYRFLHDVEAYALGVCARHQLKDKVLCLCIGTGAGSAYLNKGKVLKSGAGVPENGWFYMYPFRSGMIDDSISVRGIEALAKRYMGQVVSPLDVSLQARQGVEEAVQTYQVFGQYLMEAMKRPLDEFSPECFVLGGNISKSADLFISPLAEELKRRNCRLIIESSTSDMIFNGLSTLSADMKQ